MATQSVELLKAGSTRVFVQDGGINPSEPFDYMGCMTLGEASKDLGASEPVYCPSPEQYNKWDIVDLVPTAETLGSMDFTERMTRTLRNVWFDLKKRGCFFNIYVNAGQCTRPDDFTQWEAKVLYKQARLTNITIPAFNPLGGDENAALDVTGSLEFRDFVILNRLVFGERADSTILAEILDGFYNDVASCGDCGVASDGCDKYYWLATSNTGSPGLSAQVIVSTNDGATHFAVDIPSLGGATANRMAAVGKYAVVVSQNNGAHHYLPFEDLNNALTTWTRVATGYVASKAPRAIYSKNAALTFVAAAGGYVYLMTNPTIAVTVLTDGTLTAQDLNDIHGNGRTIVSVGNSNALIYSANDGETFTLGTGPEGGANLTSVWVINDNLWFVGTNSGKLWYTLNKGTSWTQIALTSGITTINDIHFVDDTVGYVVAQAGGAAVVLSTLDSGYSWQRASNTDARLQKVPTADRLNVIVPCGYNIVAVGGRKTVGGDGVLSVAE